MIYTKKANFPYPVLMNFTNEYKDALFELDVDLRDNSEEFFFDITWKISSKFIKKKLEDGSASIVLIIKSKDNQFRFLYNGIIIKHQKTEPTYTKTSLFLCEKRRFLWPGLRKEGNLFKLAGPGGLAFFHLTKKEVSKWPMKK